MSPIVQSVGKHGIGWTHIHRTCGGDPHVGTEALQPDDEYSDDQPSPIKEALRTVKKFVLMSSVSVNVAHFMCEWITNPETWNDWKGRLPVIIDAMSAHS